MEAMEIEKGKLYSTQYLIKVKTRWRSYFLDISGTKVIIFASLLFASLICIVIVVCSLSVSKGSWQLHDDSYVEITLHLLWQIKSKAIQEECSLSRGCCVQLLSTQANPVLVTLSNTIGVEKGEAVRHSTTLNVVVATIKLSLSFRILIPIRSINMCVFERTENTLASVQHTSTKATRRHTDSC